MDRMHEIDLEAILIAHHPNQAASGLVGAQRRRAQLGGDAPYLFHVGRRLAEKEIEIDGRYRRALKRRRGIADQDSFQSVTFQNRRDPRQNRRAIHRAIIRCPRNLSPLY